VLNAPRGDAEFERSIHKAFTDCYFAKGFTGGGWSYALNSNDTDGQEINDESSYKCLREKDRMVAWYVIGWDSIEVCVLFPVLLAVIIDTALGE
jgi:hypothetical protein